MTQKPNVTGTFWVKIGFKNRDFYVKNLGEVECQDCGFDSLTPLNMPILILEGYGKVMELVAYGYGEVMYGGIGSE